MLLNLPVSCSFVVIPSRIEFEGAPGRAYAETLTIRNTGDTAEDIHISLCDWTIDREGNVQWLPPGELARTLCPWVSLSAWQFQLEPGESREVEVKLEVQEDPGPGSYWGMIVVSGNPLPLLPEEGQFTMRMHITYGVALYYTNTKSALRAGVISDVRASPGEDGDCIVTFGFDNVGNAILRPHGYILIRDASGADVCRAEVDQFVVLPGKSTKIIKHIEGNLTRGCYLAIVVIDYGGENLVAGQRNFVLEN